VSDKINGIDGGRPASLGVRRTSQRPQDPSGTACESASAGDTTSVHITGAASQLASLEQALRDLPAVDEVRVSSIRSAIDQGTYQVSPGKVADSFLQLEHLMGAPGVGGK